tara:strand:+ start:157 stop:489 length:333 start_codon:yes stop_codon:yes gene_type:complete
MSRYSGRTEGLNKNEMYKKLLEDRGVEEIIQYTTPRLKLPSEEEMERIRTSEYIWKTGDKFWRLASKLYGDPRLWWVIAQFNQKPTEGHLKPGDVIKLPIDLSVILGAVS